MHGPPQRIGSYEVGREIGRGGMGIVYLAQDTALGRQVAIKALPEEYLSDAGRLERFMHEARMLAQLRSPHIAAIHHLEKEGGRAFLILEFVEGESLAQRLMKGPVAVRHALSWARQMALGLEAAHARGIVHRDLKPGNVMITPENEVKVLDFGLAKLVAPPRGLHGEATTMSGAATVAGEALGTPGYMSPEQVRGENVDQRADIWAFGCVLYECLAGRRAFSGRSQHDAVSAVLRDDPDFALLSHAVPQRIRDLLRRCLTKDPARRLRDIGDARLEIEDALSPPEGEAAPTPPPTPTNIPEDLTSFIGRRGEIDEVAALIARHRLVTLHGCGGGGKTRLAIQVAREVIAQFPGGAWLVELAALNDGAMLAIAAAGALGVPDSAGDRAQAIAEHLGAERTLLILDNCEHLIDASALFAGDMLRRCPGVTIVATSREALRTTGEQCYLVEAMGLPPPNARASSDIAQCEAVQLFLERARLVRADFSIHDGNAPAIGDICRRLEGIPLAIELAAARLRALPPADIRDRLRDCFDLLSRGPRGQGGASDRHRTLRATVDWSYTLLPEAEQALLRRLSVFRGGWTLEAAENLAGDLDDPVIDLLEALVEKSLVMLEEREGGASRYRMLEIIREYADSTFADQGERARARAAHHACCLALAASADADLSAGREQQRWLMTLTAEHDNMRAALAWSMNGDSSAREAGVRLTLALLNFWYLRGHLTEGRRWFDAAKARGADLSPELRARCHGGAGVLAYAQGDYRAARADYERSLSLWREISNEERSAAAMTNLGMALFESERDCAGARRHLEESRRIYQALDVQAKVPMVDLNLSVVCIAEGRIDEAERLLLSCRDAFALCGDENRLGFTFYNLGRAALRQGQHDRAMTRFSEAAAIALRLGIDSLLAPTMALMATVVFERGQLKDAVALCAGALRLYERSLAAAPEQDVSESCASIVAAARDSLGSATFDEVWTCARESEPAELVARHGVDARPLRNGSQ